MQCLHGVSYSLFVILSAIQVVQTDVPLPTLDCLISDMAEGVDRKSLRIYCIAFARESFRL